MKFERVIKLQPKILDRHVLIFETNKDFLNLVSFRKSVVVSHCFELGINGILAILKACYFKLTFLSIYTNGIS